MTDYIERRESIRYWLGDDVAGVLKTVAGRYAGANPEIPFALRPFHASGILQTEEGYYDFNLADRFPDAGHGQAVYALGKVWSDDERSIDAGLMPFGPVRFYLNEELLYRSGAVDEMKPDAKAHIPLLLRKGWNSLLLEMRKTASGFGCLFGAEEGKVRILQVLAPFEERREFGGWIYSEPTTAGRYGGASAEFPNIDGKEKDSGVRWLPVARWSADEAKRPNLERLFGLRDGAPVAGYAWSRLPKDAQGEKTVWRGRTLGPAAIWLDGRPVIELATAGSFERELPLAFANGDVLVRTISGESGWGFELEVRTASGEAVAFEPPAPIQGDAGAWLFAGPIPADAAEPPEAVQTVKRLFALAPVADADGSEIEPGSANASGENTALANGNEALGAQASDDGGNEKAALFGGWSLDGPTLRLRPYYENAMLSNKWTSGSATNFGRWDYPLGVTMYGLLRTAKELDRPDLAEYALAHIDACTDWYDYSLWDRRAYGFPSVNHQLVLMKMLDNCGSFGSAMLEAYRYRPNPDYLRIAASIADFIENKLERREDGAYYRLCVGEYSADTMWADDLYMSTPFLSRYALITGESKHLDDAASQFLLFRKYLFIPELGVMSHVFDFKYGRATGVPWGRGNGWTLFSLSELLERLPESHEDRPALLDFFRELCAGIAAQQGESGLWRQVLTDPEAYEEASCTAMFAYAFARGVRFGWLPDAAHYAKAARRGWKGLTTKALDRKGNVHGVCSGSRYAFIEDYYKYDLLTVVNDNHGTGIMMLAGVEIGRLGAYADRQAAVDPVRTAETEGSEAK